MSIQHFLMSIWGFHASINRFCGVHCGVFTSPLGIFLGPFWGFHESFPEKCIAVWCTLAVDQAPERRRGNPRKEAQKCQNGGHKMC